MNLRDISSYVARILFVILAVLSIIMLGLKIIGNSPSHIEILYTTIGTIAVYFYFFSRKVYHFMGEMKEFKRTTIRSFDRISWDIDEIKKDIKEEFSDVKKELKLIAEKVK